MKNSNLMKVGLVAVVLLLVASGVTLMTGENLVEEAFESDDFILHYPKEWHTVQELEDSYSGRKMAIADQKNEDDAEEMILYMEDDDDLSVEEFKEKFKDGEMKNQFDELKEVKVADRTAYEATGAQNEIDGEDFKMDGLIIRGENDVIHMVMYIGMKDKYNPDLRQAVFDSFELK
ncbi:MAG: hypothetical protein ACQEQF_05850 [Bacillota bacterium]